MTVGVASVRQCTRVIPVSGGAALVDVVNPAGDLGEELEELALAGSAAVSVGSHHPAIGVEHLVLVVPVCGEGPENRQRGKGVCVRALWAWGCMRANVYMYVGVTDEQYKRKEVLNMYEKRRRKRKKKH